jgi:hypothetical protein
MGESTEKMVVYALGATIHQLFKSFSATLSSAGTYQPSQENDSYRK